MKTHHISLNRPISLRDLVNRVPSSVISLALSDVVSFGRSTLLLLNYLILRTLVYCSDIVGHCGAHLLHVGASQTSQSVAKLIFPHDENS